MILTAKSQRSLNCRKAVSFLRRAQGSWSRPIRWLRAIYLLRREPQAGTVARLSGVVRSLVLASPYRCKANGLQHEPSRLTLSVEHFLLDRIELPLSMFFKMESVSTFSSSHFLSGKKCQMNERARV